MLLRSSAVEAMMAAPRHDVQCQVGPDLIDNIDLSELDRGTPATHGYLHVTKRSRLTAWGAGTLLQSFRAPSTFGVRLPRTRLATARAGTAGPVGWGRPGEERAMVGVFEGGRILVSGATTCSRRALQSARRSRGARREPAGAGGASVRVRAADERPPVRRHADLARARPDVRRDLVRAARPRLEHRQPAGRAARPHARTRRSAACSRSSRPRPRPPACRTA